MNELNEKTRSVATLVIFKLCWLAIVFGAVWSKQWLGLAAITAFVAYEVVARRRSGVLVPAVAVGVLGFAVDNAYVLSGLMSFSEPGVAPAPYWMALLWVNFALIVEHGLSFLKGRPALAAFLGAIGGPSAYYAGVRLGLLELHASPVIAMGIVALTWAVAMPLLMHFLRGPTVREPHVGGYAPTD